MPDHDQINALMELTEECKHLFPVREFDGRYEEPLRKAWEEPEVVEVTGRGISQGDVIAMVDQISGTITLRPPQITVNLDLIFDEIRKGLEERLDELEKQVSQSAYDNHGLSARADLIGRKLEIKELICGRLPEIQAKLEEKFNGGAK